MTTIIDTHFVFNGVASTTFGVFLPRSSLHIPMLPKTRERLQEVSGRAGAWDYGPSFSPLEFHIDIVIIETTRNNLLAQVQGLASLLDPRAGAKPLILSDRPSMYWLARLSGVVDWAPLASVGELSLPFIAVDPFSHAI